MRLHVGSLLLALALPLAGCVLPTGGAAGGPGAGPVLQETEVRLEPGATHTAAVIQRATGFQECLLSWNVSGPEAGAWIELRVGRADGGWSPWLHVGEWHAPRPTGAVRAFGNGRIDVDYFRSERRWFRVQARVRAWTGGTGPLTVSLLGFAFDPVRPTPGTAEAPDPRVLGAVLDVPALSQREQDPSIASRVCSPTSVTMVLRHHGRAVDVATAAAAIHDPAHDLFGNWPRAMQYSHEQGLRGYLARYDRWGPVEERILRGEPVVISVAFGEGELTGAPMESTGGHLLVVCGFDGGGNVVVNDPAARTASGVRRTYDRDELGRAWWGHGGTAYVIERAEP